LHNGQAYLVSANFVEINPLVKTLPFPHFGHLQAKKGTNPGRLAGIFLLSLILIKEYTRCPYQNVRRGKKQ
jgi:hypothetical protein